MKRRAVSRHSARLLLLTGILGACHDDGFLGQDPAPAVSEPPPIAEGAVSALSPFNSGCSGSPSGTQYRNAEVEPYAAINPLNPANLIAVWQQDRWSSGGAQGVLAAVSLDGGASWSQKTIPFSRCAGGNAGNGGDYARATDPWVSFGGDGTAYFMSLSFSDSDGSSAMLVSRSTDGGRSWGDPVTLVRDTGSRFNDKNTLTADPVIPGYAYAVWDRLDSSVNRGPTLFSRTTDGGLSWEAARVIHDPDYGQTIGNVIVAHPAGALVNLFVEIDYATDIALLRVMTSVDQGQTWAPPVTITELQSVGVFDPDDGAPVRAGTVVPAIAVSAAGRIAVVWGDGRFSEVHDDIVLSMSDDVGLTWSAPTPVSGQLAASFTPTVHFLDDESLGVAYYDFRDNTPAPGSLTSYWLASSVDGLTWGEQRLAEPFDLKRAPNANGLFLGDYMALLADGAAFRAYFVVTNDSTVNRTDVVQRRAEPSPVTLGAKSYRPAPVPTVLTAEARGRIRDAIRRAVPHGRHDSPLSTMPDLAVLP